MKITAQLLLGSTILLSTTISTQLSADTTISNSAIETIVVTGRRDSQPIENLIGAIGQINNQDMQLIGHQHISQTAARLPGVWLSRGNGQELLAAVRSPVFTGAGSCGEIQTSEDGLPIRPTGMCNVNQLFEVNSEQAAGLEVWRGPGTVFYGSNALHGVINTLSPQIERNYLSLETASNDYNRVKLGWNQQRGTQQWQVAANGVKDGGFKDDSGFDQQKLSLKHQWSGTEISSDTHFSAVNLNQETAGFIRGENAYRDPLLWKTNPNPEAFRDAQAFRLSTRLSNISNISNTKDDLSEWQITPYLRHSSMTFLQHYLPGQAEEKNGQTSAGIQSSHKQYLNADTSLWLGADIEWGSMWVEEFQANALGTADNVRYQGQHYDFEVDSQQFAAFANLESAVSSKLTAEAGVRLETINYDYQNNMLAGTTRDDGSACNSSDGSCRYFRPEDRSDSNDNLNLHLGVNYQISPALSAYSRVASAYRAPQINELYRLQKEQQINDIKPVQLKSFEAGLRFYNDALSAELNFYRMNKKQVILKDSDGFLVNDGETTHRGVEWQLGYALNSNWQIATAGAWAKHLYSKSSPLNGVSVNGNDIDTAPRYQGGAQLRYQPSEGMTAELEWLYLGSYFLDAVNAHKYPGHNVLNLSWRQSFEHWELRLRATNLGDRRIADRADFAFGSYRYFVGEGRGVLAEIKHYF
ncbi:MAG: TonB-dependent receptor [Porticoccaceae bacterium]|nr:TonB-dependent receptor [Porticoccaceae bacterium]